MTSQLLGCYLRKSVLVCDDEVLESVKKFAENVKSDSPAFALDLMDIVNSAKQPISVPLFPVFQRFPAFDLNDYSSYFLFMNFEDAEIAEQLTLRDWELYTKIHPRSHSLSSIHS